MNKQKQDIIESIQKALTSEMTFIQDRDMNPVDKAMAIDILLDTIKFLDNYEEHTKVLNNYISEKKGIER